MFGIFLAVLTACSFATLDATRKKLAVHMEPIHMMIWFCLGALLLYLPFIIGDSIIPPVTYWGPAAIQMTLNTTSQLLFLRAIHLTPLSLAIPFLSLTPALAAVFGIPLLGEYPNRWNFLGIVLIVGGAWMLSRGADQTLEAQARKRIRRGLMMMVGVAICWSLVPVVDKICMQHVSPPLHGFWQFVGIGLVLIALTCLKGELAQVFRIGAFKRLLLLNIVVASGAVLLQLFALTYIFASALEGVKRGIGLTLALINGFIFFGEPITARKVNCIAVILSGVLMVLLL